MNIFSFSSKFILLLFVFGFTLPSVFAQEKVLYSYQLDLTKVKDDKVPVELLIENLETFLPSVEPTDPPKENYISFFMPKIVPGTYHIYDFGRFLSDFKVFDKEGEEIKFTHPNENEWRFPSKNVAKITYLVDDTFDSKEKNKVFEPGGTDIEDDVFVLNTHGFFGYLEDLKRQPFEINIIKPYDKIPIEFLLKDLNTFKESSKISNNDSISFFIPKTISGTSHIYDFGRFLSDFKILDKKGQEIGFSHPNKNEWRFPTENAHKITYLVNTTFDSQEKNKVFEQRKIDSQNDPFITNTPNFFGYLEESKNQPIEINILKPKSFYGSTPLVATKSDDKKDTYLVSDYHLLADSPMLYCVPDTVTFDVGGAEILVSVFHEKGTVKAKEVAKEVQKSLEAQKNYLGGTLPIKKYAFLIYIFDGFSNSGSYGALEHSYSSLYFLPNWGAERLANTVVEIAAHEFFHILTPLSIHSEQIHYFDFINPKMSKHLWLYEGVTEYFANHVLLQQNLISLEEFLDKMREKVSEANNFSDVSFTEMSLGCLDEYADDYGNVYEKGALIGWMLDIRLRELSDGKYGLMNLMQDLSKKYGTEQPFEDEKLFDVIAEMTYPEIRTFFADYVEGNKELPYKNYLQTIGIQTTGEGTEEVFNFGNIGLAVDPQTKEVSVFSMEGANEFGKMFEEGDILLEINNQKVDASNFLALISIPEDKEDEEMKILVRRKKGKKKNKTKEYLLKSKPIFVEQEQDFGFEEIQNKNEKQMQLLKAWEKWKL